MSDYLIRQYDEVRESVAVAAAKAGRSPDEVRLIAVSKTFPAADIAALYAHGHRLFGESKIQELETKAVALPADVEWHLIGHLQSNKAAKALQYASCIHTVDGLRLLERLDRLAGESGRTADFLLELNLSGEMTKFGLAADEARRLAAAAAACRHLKFRGLMTMAPYEASEAELHRLFGGLRELRDLMENDCGLKLPELSMGMSGDYRIAVAEGATLVRIGTAIFGKRDYS